MVKISTNGRIGALLALGSDFHPNFTGRKKCVQDSLWADQSAPAKRFGCTRLNMFPGTLAGCLQTIAPLFKPLHAALQSKLRSEPNWHVDEIRSVVTANEPCQTRNSS